MNDDIAPPPTERAHQPYFAAALPNPGGDEAHEEEEIIAYSLRDLANFGGDTPSFVKIDCEGGEWAVLSDPLAADIPVIVGEWHNVRGHVQTDIASLLGAPASATTPRGLRDAAVLGVLYATGMRATEIVNLRVEVVGITKPGAMYVSPLIGKP